MVYRRTVTHHCTNRARRRATTLFKTYALPLNQAAQTIVSWGKILGTYRPIVHVHLPPIPKSGCDTSRVPRSLLRICLKPLQTISTEHNTWYIALRLSMTICISRSLAGTASTALLKRFRFRHTDACMRSSTTRTFLFRATSRM